MRHFHRIEECPDCKRLFGVQVVGDFPFKEREDIHCAYCKRVVMTVRIRGVFESHALTADEEREYRTGGRTV